MTRRQRPSKPPVRTPLGEWLEAERAQRDITQQEFATSVLGFTDHAKVSKWINGRTLPKRDGARQLAQRLNRPLAEVYALIDQSEVVLEAADPINALLSRPLRYAIVTPNATLGFDPRMLGRFYGFMREFERMTEEERNSIDQDEIDIPESPPRHHDGEKNDTDHTRPPPTARPRRPRDGDRG